MDSPVKTHLYEWFIEEIGNDIGQLTPISGEDPEDIVRSLVMSASRMSVQLHIRTADGLIYFRVARGLVN